MFFSLRNYILSDINLSDRNNFGEIVKILFGNARFMIFFAVIFCLCVLFLIIGIIRINKNASEFLVYVIAVILLYELFILKRIYKATNFDDRTVKRKDNFKEFFTDFLVGKSFKSKLAEKDELTNGNEEELNNLKGINDFSFDGSDKEEEKSKTNLENLKDEKESKEKNNSKEEKNDSKKDLNKPKKDNNKITKEKEDKADTKNGSIILVTKENSKKPESMIQKQPISSEDSENFKKTDKITSKDILKKTDDKSEIKKEEEKLNEPEKEILKKIAGNPERKEKIKILKIKVKDKKDEENKNEKETEKNKNEEEAKENKNEEEPEENKDKEEKRENEEKKEEKRENRKEGENKKTPKVKLNKTEGDIYLTKIKQNINLKNDALNKVTLLRENLDGARSQVSTMVKELRTNFFNLLAVSDKIEHILLSIGIPLSIQKYELEELENEINNKFTLEDIGLEIVKDEIKNKEGHKKVKFTLLKSNPNEKIIESLKKIKNRIRINDEPINIEQNLSFIESILVLEAIISLIFLIVLIFDFSDYVKYFRFVILIILILNVFIGVYTLIISELLNKKCLMKEKEGCKQNIHKVNELVMLLNKNASFEEDQIEVIKNEFDKISSKTEKNIEALENYLKNIFRSKLGVKIFIFENLIDKLRFIEGDFEELMKNSVDKKLFYTNVDLLARSLEKIKNFLKNTNTYKVIDVYKDLVIVNSFFKNERDSVNENVKRIIKLDLQKENKYKTKTCETFIKKICNFSELIDEVSFILIFCSFLLLVLVLI